MVLRGWQTRSIISWLQQNMAVALAQRLPRLLLVIQTKGPQSGQVAYLTILQVAILSCPARIISIVFMEFHPILALMELSLHPIAAIGPALWREAAIILQLAWGRSILPIWFRAGPTNHIRYILYITGFMLCGIGAILCRCHIKAPVSILNAVSINIFFG